MSKECIPEYFQNTTVSLCPNCHTYVHHLYSINDDNNKLEFFKTVLKPSGYTAAEYCKMENIKNYLNEYTGT